MEELLACEAVSECFALQTCNRAEWYVVTPEHTLGESVLREAVPTEIHDEAAWYTHTEALEHLLRVGAGLESMVLGEDEILGQLRSAASEAEQVGGLGYLLEDAVWKAIHLGERARTETEINEGIVSLAQAAVALTRARRDLDSASAAVLGAGEMGRRAATTLSDVPVDELYIANRTLERAEDVARAVPTDAHACGLDDLGGTIADVDVVIAAIAEAGEIVDRETLARAGETLLVDLGQPRNVPRVPDLEHIERFDLEDLEAITDETRTDRCEAASEVETMVAAELDHLHDRFKRKQADEVIAAMYTAADRIKDREVEAALNRLEAREALTEEGKAVVTDLADALVGQIMAAPTKSLREAAAADDWETIQTALMLFDPEMPGGAVSMEDRELSSGSGILEEDV